ncbi:MAG: sulfatase-like hydrolase/transferase [Bacteroidaceae bacterium]|nr:sulfatase-like hydrolase/transferase [Bacteroidaceae bacterium]
MSIRKSLFSSIIAFFCNMVLAYVAYGLCRVAFVLENGKTYADSWADNSLADLLKGALVFDTSALLYTNMLYVVLMLFPLHWKERDGWQTMAKWVFVVVNGLCVVMNLADAVYFQYTGRRTTVTVFSEFGNEQNLGGIVGVELLNHWYLVLAGVLIIAMLWVLYVRPKGRPKTHPLWAYYLLHLVVFVAYVPLSVFGMRGGATTAVRPITISNANQYVNKPVEAAIVLNTPFSLIRTINKKVFEEPSYFSDPAELAQVYTPVHVPCDSLTLRRKNVVVLIVESFGREYIGAYNETLEGGNYRGYTPFVDSLYQDCLSFDYTFCNGRKSIDGMPSILSSIPMFVEPFFLTPASLNDVSGLARELGNSGYYSAFFHGAENGSMGFQAFARTTGFKDYFGRTEYKEDPRFDGDADFDGMWAIWDEPFLQFFALKMSEFKEPFVSAVFTASSHHPYVIPDKYKEQFPEEGGQTIHKCIRYTDMSLRRFFETARRQPWFENTIFVFTSDHTNQTCHKEYQTDLGFFGAPILFFDPSGEMPRGRRHAVAQQIDIMPSVLSWLGYDRPYVAFGCDLFTTPDEETWAVQYVGGEVYQYVKGDYVLQIDGDRVKAVYNYKDDWFLTHNLIGTVPEQDQMERELKAIIQQYMHRMNNNELKP